MVTNSNVLQLTAQVTPILHRLDSYLLCRNSFNSENLMLLSMNVQCLLFFELYYTENNTTAHYLVFKMNNYCNFDSFNIFKKKLGQWSIYCFVMLPLLFITLNRYVGTKDTKWWSFPYACTSSEKMSSWKQHMLLQNLQKT